jgi:AcrR family transcriptional regulator
VAANVRYRIEDRELSGNAGRASAKGGVDRRVQRTRRTLQKALIALILEKRFDTITVQDVLDRADVGRSTFYAHFRSKEDLFRSDFENLLGYIRRGVASSGARGERILPVRELFEHVREFRRLYRAMAASTLRGSLYRLSVAHIAAGIEEALRARQRPRHRPPIPLPILANHIAVALLSTLDWWVGSGMPHEPERMDEIFHALVMPGVHAAVGRAGGAA